MDGRTGETTSKAKPARTPFRAQTLVALAICGGALFWAYRTATEGMKPTNRWAKLLRSGDVNDRRIAARQLGDSDPAEIAAAIPALVAGMGDESDSVRAEVASGLGTAGMTAMNAEGKQAQAKEVAQALTKALSDSGAEVRTSAAFALGEFAGQPKGKVFPADPAEVASAMAGLLADPSDSVRSTAGPALARVASKAPIAPPKALVEGVNSWPLKESRKAAALVLGSFKGDAGPTVAALTRALGDEEPGVRSDAAGSLRNFGLDAAQAVPALVKNLADPFIPPPPPEFTVVSQATRMDGSQGPIGGDGPEPTDPAVQAALAIGQIMAAQVEKGGKPPADVVEALTKAAQSGRQELKDAAGTALRRIGKGASAAIPSLIEALVDSTPKAGPGPGPTTAALLGDLAPGTERAGEAIAALTSALDAKDPGTRTAAVKSLGRFGPAASAALPKLRQFVERRVRRRGQVRDRPDRGEDPARLPPPQRAQTSNPERPDPAVTRSGNEPAPRPAGRGAG